VPPWTVDVEFDGPTRRYRIGDLDITNDVLHIRYQARVTDLHGRGPLEAGRSRMVAANLLMRYTDNLLASGGVPTTVLTHPGELTAKQSDDLRAQWVTARMATMGLPAVLSGGTTFEQLTLSPKDLTLTDLSAITETRIANLLGVPGYMVGLPQSSDSLVYNTAALTLDFHWRACLRNLVRQVMGALSAWALPVRTTVELNRDEYIKPALLERAQAYQILNSIGALSADEIRQIERYSTSAPSPTLTAGVLQ
jgi:HK97 family phage portal protein